MKVNLLIAFLLVCLGCAAGRKLSEEAPASEDPVEFDFPTVAEAREIPLPKCFTTEVTRSAESASCVTLAHDTRTAIDNITDTGSVQPRASITCGKDTTISVDKLGSCPDAQATLNAHNAARARWGAAPLLWSKQLSNYAESVSNTCNFAHSNGPYGENLAIGSGLSCQAAVDLWMSEQNQWPPGGTPGFSSATGHFSAIVWKSTTQVGCATVSCSGRNFVTCSYNPPGNVIGQFVGQVGYLGQTPECVATGGPALPSTKSPPPISTTPRLPPRLPVVPGTPRPPAPPLGRCCYFYICFRC